MHLYDSAQFCHQTLLLTERNGQSRDKSGDLKGMTEGKLHVRDCENHKLIGLGISPTIQVLTLVSNRGCPLFSL